MSGATFAQAAPRLGVALAVSCLLVAVAGCGSNAQGPAVDPGGSGPDVQVADDADRTDAAIGDLATDLATDLQTDLAPDAAVIDVASDPAGDLVTDDVADVALDSADALADDAAPDVPDLPGDTSADVSTDVSPDDIPPDVAWPGTSATIDGQGGTITLEGVTLEIPPGALDQAVEITIARTPLSAEGFEALSPIYRFGPAGLKFATPAHVTFDYDPTVYGGHLDELRVRVYWSDTESLLAPELSFADPAQRTVSAWILHFSDGAAGTDAKTCCFFPSDEEDLDADPDTFEVMSYEDCHKLHYGASALEIGYCDPICCNAEGRVGIVSRGDCLKIGGTPTGSNEDCDEVCCTQGGAFETKPAKMCVDGGGTIEPDSDKCSNVCCFKNGEFHIQTQQGCVDGGGVASPASDCSSVCCSVGGWYETLIRGRCTQIGGTDTGSLLDCNETCCYFGLDTYRKMIQGDCKDEGGQTAWVFDCRDVCCRLGYEREVLSSLACQAKKGGSDDLFMCDEVCCKDGDFERMWPRHWCKDGQTIVPFGECDQTCCKVGKTYRLTDTEDCAAPVADAYCNDVCCGKGDVRWLDTQAKCEAVGTQILDKYACAKVCCDSVDKVMYNDQCDATGGRAWPPEYCSKSTAVKTSCLDGDPVPGGDEDGGVVALNLYRNNSDKFDASVYDGPAGTVVSFPTDGPDARARIRRTATSPILWIQSEGYGGDFYTSMVNGCKTTEGGSGGVKPAVSGVSDTGHEALGLHDAVSKSGPTGTFYNPDNGYSSHAQAFRIDAGTPPNRDVEPYLDLLIDSSAVDPNYTGNDAGDVFVTYRFLPVPGNVSPDDPRALAVGDYLVHEVSAVTYDLHTVSRNGPLTCPGMNADTYGAGSGELFYRFTALADGTVKLVLETNRSLLWSATAGDLYVLDSAGACVAGIGNASELILPVRAGESYRFVLDGGFDPSNLFALWLKDYDGPPNYSCETASPISALPFETSAQPQESSRKTPRASSYMAFQGQVTTAAERSVYYRYAPSSDTAVFIEARSHGGGACPQVYVQRGCGQESDGGDWSWHPALPLGREDGWCRAYTEFDAQASYTILVENTGDLFDLRLVPGTHPTNGTCAQAEVVDAYPAKVTAAGLFAGNDFSIAKQVTGYAAVEDGDDLVYEVHVPAGQYVNVTEKSGAFVYAVEGPCPTAVVTALPPGVHRVGDVVGLAAPAGDAVYYVIVDGFGLKDFVGATVATAELTFEALPLPGNDTCGTASVIDVYPHLQKGTTAWAGSDYQNADASECGAGFDFGPQAPDLVYTLDTTTADALSILVGEHTAYSHVFYVQSTCDADLSDCLGAHSVTSDGNELYLTGLSAHGQASLIVDGIGSGNSNRGPFDFLVARVSPPANETCATAQAIDALPFTYIASTRMATDDHSLPAGLGGACFASAPVGAGGKDVVLSYVKKAGDKRLVLRTGPGYDSFGSAVYVNRGCESFDAATCRALYYPGYYAGTRYADIATDPDGTAFYVIIDGWAGSGKETEGTLYLVIDVETE